MTRTPARRLLALALAAALAPVPAVTALAQSANPFSLGGAPTDSPQPETGTQPAAFTVSDIRVDGLQRISAGTVFTYLPIERGDTIDQSRAAEAIRALYRTGFFEDVRLGRQGDILVVTVTERPAINKLTLEGNKDIKTEDLQKGLNDIGLTEGGTFDRHDLDQVTQELTRQYNNRGKYNVQITPQVSRLDRNRVDITIHVEEGKPAKIRHINLIGNQKFEQEDITDRWESQESNWLSWYRRDDQYSREKLSGDLEKLNEYYLDRGYIDFSVDSTQVAISPDKRDMFITAGLTEGEPYTVSDVQLTGDTVLPKENIEKMVLVKSGQTFSRQLLELTSDSITATLGNIGYAFAQVNAVPDLNREKHTVAINLQVVPGPRVNVRRVVFKGNTRTADEVLRREMRQFEGSWYSQAAIDRSKIRLQRLGFFETVDVENVPVPGVADQVDVVYTVKETTSGSFVFGLGFSQLSGLTTSIQLQQNNFLGSGNRVSVEAQRNDYLQRYAFSFLNPYFTDEGMSLGYNLTWREFDNSDFNTAAFSTTNRSGSVTLGLPITESDTISALVGIDSNEIFTFPGTTPASIVNYIDALGEHTFHAWRTELAWARDTRNDYFTPTRGTYQRVSAEITLPGSTVEYFKLNYQFSKFWPLSRALVLNTRAELGYGDSYGSPIERTSYCLYPLPAPTDDDNNPATPPVQHPRPPTREECAPGDPDYHAYNPPIVADGLPFFENFYAGGTRSVRGFRDNTLGPREGTQALGGAVKTVGSLEMFFPTLIKSPSARVSAFIDFGNVYRDADDFNIDTMRYSAGVALLWRAPVGPISISYAFPIHQEPGDEPERLQFTFGGAF
jgi:outer membrane protein insertion porin family